MKADSYAKRFAKAVAVRAVKTLCQTAVASIGTAMAMGDVNWAYVASASALAALVSALMSVAAGLPEVKMPETEGIDLDEHA